MGLGMLWRILEGVAFGLIIFVLLPVVSRTFKSGHTITFQDIGVIGFTFVLVFVVMFSRRKLGREG
jgi:ABC-type branched-subunit amino acid transport system permease subunit